MSKTLSPQALSNLIGAIYDCALDPARWEQTLRDTTALLDCRTVVLHLNDLRRDRLLMYKSVGIEPYWLEQVEKHVAEMHALLPLNPVLDEPHVLSRHVAKPVIEGSPFVKEWLRPQGLCDIMQLFVMHTATRFSGLGIGRHDLNGIITEREIEIARLLLPHVRRAVTISDLLDIRTIERARMSEALDALRCGVVLTDKSGAILHANRSAERMLGDGGPIQSVGGVLQARVPSAAAELGVAIRLAAQDEIQIGKTGLAIQLTEPDAAAVFAHVLPMKGGDLRRQLHPAIVAGVFIGEPPDGQEGAEMLAAAYDLTRAETRVLASLLCGRTLPETAAALGIAASTVNTHLDNIFAKTGVSRQADLIRLGTGLIPPTK